MSKKFKPCSDCQDSSAVYDAKNNKYICAYCKKDVEEIIELPKHNVAIVNGHGNVIIQSHSGDGDNVAGDIVYIDGKKIL